MPKAGQIKVVPLNESEASKYVRSTDETALEGHFTVLGQMGSGKSTMAASVSSFWPGTIPAKKKVDLADMLWVSFDRGGTAGFSSLKINVPYLIDARAIISDKGIEGGIEHILELAKKIVDSNPQIKRAALDTVSKFDTTLVEHYKRVNANNSNKYAAWDSVLMRHGRLYNGIDKLGLQMASTFHTKAKMEAVGEQVKSRAAMALPSEESDLIYAISGQARVIYLSDASIKGVIHAVVSKRDGTTRKFFPFGGKQAEGGCRYHELLDDEEPADFQKIFAKIKAGLK